MHVLKVRAAHTAMVPDFEALDDGVMRFVGRRLDPTIGRDRPKRKGEPAGAKQGGWVPTDEIVEVPHRAEYVQEIQAGALLPGDEATARFCKVPFSPPDA